MSTLGAFDASPLGVFVESPLGARDKAGGVSSYVVAWFRGSTREVFLYQYDADGIDVANQNGPILADGGNTSPSPETRQIFDANGFYYTALDDDNLNFHVFDATGAVVHTVAGLQDGEQWQAGPVLTGTTAASSRAWWGVSGGTFNDWWMRAYNISIASGNISWTVIGTSGATFPRPINIRSMGKAATRDRFTVGHFTSDGFVYTGSLRGETGSELASSSSASSPWFSHSGVVAQPGPDGQHLYHQWQADNEAKAYSSGYARASSFDFVLPAAAHPRESSFLLDHAVWVLGSGATAVADVRDRDNLDTGGAHPANANSASVYPGTLV